MMANIYAKSILEKIAADFGAPRKIGTGNSLFHITSKDVIVYFRYSKISKGSNYSSAFYGLRNEDLLLMEGKTAFVCLLWNDETSPIMIPYGRFEYYFNLYPPSSDGQYKVQLFFKRTGTELYIAKVGKFNVDSYFGIDDLYKIKSKKLKIPRLSHGEVQSLLGAIGSKKGFDIWFPLKDRSALDLCILDDSCLKDCLPTYSKEIDIIIAGTDVIWLDSTQPVNFFEVEHSTPVYSGLLRFNDISISIGGVNNFNIVADCDREDKFSREINRPTFRQSKLIDKVAFITYENVYNWYYNLYGELYEIKM